VIAEVRGMVEERYSPVGSVLRRDYTVITPTQKFSIYAIYAADGFRWGTENLRDITSGGVPNSLDAIIQANRGLPQSLDLKAFLRTLDEMVFTFKFLR
jgi:pantothenate kinase